MRTRKQTINDLIEASDFKDSEIVLNSDFIRDLFNDAVGQLKDATKIVADNKRHRAHIKQLKARIRQLEAERDAAVEDMTKIVQKYGESYCEYCKNWRGNTCPPYCRTNSEGFRWRGEQKEEAK